MVTMTTRISEPWGIALRWRKMSFLLGQIEIEQHEHRGPQALLCGELIKYLDGVVTIVDDLECVVVYV